MTPLLIAASVAAQLMNCVSQNAVALGATNTEPADAVIQAADGRCADEWARARQLQENGSLGAASAGGAFARMFEQTQAREAERLKAQVYSQAFQALMAARAR